MYEAKSMKCCGLSEVHGMNNSTYTPESLIEFICKKFGYATYCRSRGAERKQAGRGIFIMSVAAPDVSRKAVMGRKATQLQRYVRENGLGTVRLMPWVGNPNYQNRSKIRTVMFIPDQEGMLKYAKDKNMKPRDDYAQVYFINGA